MCGEEISHASMCSMKGEKKKDDMLTFRVVSIDPKIFALIRCDDYCLINHSQYLNYKA